MLARPAGDEGGDAGVSEDDADPNRAGLIGCEHDGCAATAAGGADPGAQADPPGRTPTEPERMTSAPPQRGWDR